MAATEARTRSLHLAGRRKVSLFVALGALGGARAAQAQSRVDLLNLLYQESDGRTTVLENMLLLHQDMGEFLGVADITLTHDTITGASPTGAYPKLDVTTSASGTSSKSAYPLARDNNHRNAMSFAYGRKFGDHLPTVDVSYGKEDDYVAREAGISDAWSFFGGRGTLHYGISEGSDIVEPVTNTLHLPRKSQSYAAGWTWVFGPDDLADVSLSHTKMHGYLDEPYKVVPVGAQLAPDHRPGSRLRDAALLKYAHHFDWDAALRVTYRYYKDDWAVRAHTLDLVCEKRLDEDWTVAPEVRFYTQTAASFYGDLFPSPRPYMSSDYRLSPFGSVLGGLAVTYRIDDGLILKLGCTYQTARGRDRITPLAPGSSLGPGALFTGPSSSSADLTTTTFTAGLSWRF